MQDQALEQLLDVWMSERNRGVTRTAAELCEDCPDMAAELNRRIEIVSRFEQLADIGDPDTRVSLGRAANTPHSNSPVPLTPRKVALLPSAIGGFTPLELLGEGGMGAVYLAEDVQLGRRVAVKVMKRELAADPDARLRFVREARAMAAIEHDNIMTIYAVGQEQEMPFLVMPVLKGETLDSRLDREGRLSIAESCRIAREIAAGLSAAHAHGLVHRDIKPSNIWLEGTLGRVRILDFGLARPATDNQKVTQSGAVLGTPAYMAPEQASGAEATPRSDLFSLGAVMYRMTTGQQPFAAPSLIATLSNLANRIPEPPHQLNSDIQPELSALIQQLIAKVPEHRPESAAAVLEALQSETISLGVGTKIQPSTERHPADVPQPRIQSESSSRHRLPRNLSTALGVGLAGLLLMVAAVVYRIQTDQGTLILTTDDDQVEAKLSKEGLVIQDANTGRTWTLTPNVPRPVPSGDYKLPRLDGLLLLVRDETGTEFTTAEFKIKRGDHTAVKVTFSPKVTAPGGPSIAEGKRRPAPPPTNWPADAPARAIAPFDAAQAKQHQDDWAKYLGVSVSYTNSLGMKFVLIPPGEFVMGSTPEEVASEIPFVDKSDARWMECLQTETPQHQVVLTDALYVGVHEVTQKQFRALSDQTRSISAAGEEDRPILWVTHANVEDFCRRLCEHEGLAEAPQETPQLAAKDGLYRLLTEAEWEYVCRAGTTTRFWAGPAESDLDDTCWYRANSLGQTHAVGTRRPNAFGVYDMLGNAWEWCQDEWSPTYYAESRSRVSVDPQGPQGNEGAFVARGGDWHDGPAVCRVAFRYGFPARFSSSGMGFRVAVPWKTVRGLQKGE